MQARKGRLIPEEQVCSARVQQMERGYTPRHAGAYAVLFGLVEAMDAPRCSTGSHKSAWR